MVNYVTYATFIARIYSRNVSFRSNIPIWLNNRPETLGLIEILFCLLTCILSYYNVTVHDQFRIFLLKRIGAY